MEWSTTLKLAIHPPTAAGLLFLLVALAAPAWVKRSRPAIGSKPVALYYLVLAGVVIWQHDFFLRTLALREGGWATLLPLVVVTLAALCVAQAFLGGRTTRPSGYYLTAGLAAFSLSSLVQYYPIADPRHIAWAIAPALGAAVLALWQWTRMSAPLVASVLVITLLPALAGKVSDLTRVLALPTVRIEAPAVLRGMRVSDDEARRYARIDTVIRQAEQHRPGLPAVLIGDDALYLCLMQNLANPLPYYVTWRGLADNEINLRRWAYIQEVRPLMFLHKARWDAVNDFYRRARYLPVLYFDKEALEIAIPQELADAIGLKAYSGAPSGEQAPKATKP